MPDVGEGLTEAEILTWYVAPGDTVHDGMVVCEVETAKAAVELPIPYDGVVHELRHPEGTSVDVGQVIISVDTTPTTTPATSAPATAAPASAVPTTAAPAAPAALAGAAALAVPPQTSPEPASAATRQPVLVGYGVSDGPSRRRPRKPALTAGGATGQANGKPAVPALNGSRPLAKPPVRKLARDLGVALDGVPPTGPDGIITRADVHAAATRPEPPAGPGADVHAAATRPEPPAGPRADVHAAATHPRPAEPPAGDPAPPVTRIPVKGVRRATAQAMVASAFSAPHVTEFVTVDVTRTVKLVEVLRRDEEMRDLRVNPLLLIARALVVAIRRHPEINASWDEVNQEIVLKHDINLGIAAATPRGLIVPNIKDAHTKSLPELARALAELVTTAREGKTSPADMRDGTVTLTNVGVFGVDTGTPILNPGESAILAVGAINLRPWVHKGKVRPRHVMTLALSFDHRLVDGELGSKVLADVARLLEHPKRFLVWGA
ncbi:dihydrolipoamide acetyltransferase family protein [Streptomyces sp. NPDC059447]|uniref:dihydrolipoamide acetyltransferase family protein n=1 Tax=Streptomyces sp. NPDC059447 TaxID=3346834 RepID=UPI0036A01B1B